jgi:hypothetical protein
MRKELKRTNGRNQRATPSLRIQGPHPERLDSYRKTIVISGKGNFILQGGREEWKRRRFYESSYLYERRAT